MTLTARILIMVLLALTPAIAVQIYNEQALRERRGQAVRAASLRFAQAISADLNQFADSARQLLDILSEEPSIRRQDAAACGPYLASVLPRVSGANIIVVTDATGTVVCNSHGAHRGDYSLADRGYFKQVMETGRSAIGEYVIGRGSGRPTIQFAHPLKNAEGTFVGLINVGYDPQWLATRFGQAGQPRDATVTVTDRNGIMLVRLPDQAEWGGKPIPPAFAARLEEALTTGGVGDMLGLRGNRRITGVVRPDGTLRGVTVAVGLSRDAAFADIDAATQRAVVLIVLVVFAAFMTALIGGERFVRRPVRQLLATASAWRRGNLGARSNLRGRSEFGQLGEAFDTMASALEKHENDLKSELKRSRELQDQQVTMLHELNHRVKNTLATVQSLARQSRGGEDQVAQLENRILALSKTHDLLTRRDWTRASLRQILENELGPYRNGQDQFRLDGAEVELPPRYVLALGMAAHELTTNAAKYGALSSENGRIDVVWRVLRGAKGEKRLRIEWQERDGPPVATPRRRGFGSRLITGGIARELAGEASLDFRAEGLCCTIDVPLEDDAFRLAS